jgi:hypothetical protein
VRRHLMRVLSFRATGIIAYLKNRGTLEKRKGGRSGEPCVNAYDAALLSAAR